MNITQMHRMIDVGVQEVASHVYDEILDEEKDLVLNNMQQAFVEKNLPREGQMDLDKIHVLQVEKVWPAFKHTNSYFTFIPSDYKHLVSLSAEVTPCTTYKEINTEAYVAIVEISKVVSDNFKIKAGSTVLFDIASYSGGTMSLTEDYLSIVVKLACNVVSRNTNIQVYWENFNGEFHNNSLIFVTTDSSYKNFTIIVEQALPKSGILAPRAYKKADSKSGSTKPARLIKGGYARFDLPFMRTNEKSPIATVTDKIYVYNNNDFVVKNISIEYIRSPREMSYKLKVDCELPDIYHREIVDESIRHFIEMFQSPRYETKIAENKLVNNH